MYLWPHKQSLVDVPSVLVWGVKRHYCDIYFCDINCAIVGYNKNYKIFTVLMFIVITEESKNQLDAT